jgi:hypothetical protein
MAVDFKSLGRNTQGALITGALALLFSFFGAYIRVSGGGRSANVTNAWDGWGVLACLLLIAAVGIVAVKAFAAETLPEGAPWTLIAFGASVISALVLIIKPFTVSNPYGDLAKISVGPGWSGWILMILLIAFAALVGLLFKESGEKMPDLNKKDTPPAPPAA